MDYKEIIKSFILKAEHDIATAKDLLKLGHYDWCLFVWHLAIEKALKALALHNEQEIIYVHDLVRLAKQTNLTLNDDLSDQLREITTFNLEARYDDYKRSFFKKADKNYATKWAATCEDIFKLIEKNIYGY